MNAVSSVIAILFPGVRTSDIANGSTEHGVHILLKEQYDPQKNYARFQRNLNPVIAEESIGLLFIFSDGTNMIAQDRRGVQKVMKRVNELHGCVL